MTGLRSIHLGPGQVARQQVWSELETVKITLETIGQCLDRGGLGQSRGPLHQQVAVGQQADQQAVHQVLLADDPGTQRIPQVDETAVDRAARVA